MSLGPLPKSAFYDKFIQTISSVVSERDARVHTDMKRYLGPAFSDKSLRAQEPLIADMIDDFVEKVGKPINSDTDGVDMDKWLNLITFDIIGELAFGKTFGGVKTGEKHPWVVNVLRSLQAGSFVDVLDKNPLFGSLWGLLHPIALWNLIQGKRKNEMFASKTIDE